jgi:hypothetical protein
MKSNMDAVPIVATFLRTAGSSVYSLSKTALLQKSPTRLENFGTITQGSAFRATLGFEPESLWDSAGPACQRTALLLFG